MGRQVCLTMPSHVQGLVGADVIILLELCIDCRLGLFCRHKPLCI